MPKFVPAILFVCFMALAAACSTTATESARSAAADLYAAAGAPRNAIDVSDLEQAGLAIDGLVGGIAGASAFWTNPSTGRSGAFILVRAGVKPTTGRSCQDVKFVLVGAGPTREGYGLICR